MSGARLIAALFAIGLAMVGPARAAISFVASQMPVPPNSAVSSVQIATPTGVVAGDLLVAFLAQRGASAPVIKTAPAGWTLALTQVNGSTSAVVVYWRVATAAEPGTHSWEFNRSDRAAGAIAAFRGVDTTAPIEAQGAQSNASSSTTMTAPSVTTGRAPTLLLALYTASQGAVTTTPPPGMTEAFDVATTAGPNGISISGAYAGQAATGATGARVATASAASVSVGVLLALNDAGLSSVDHYEVSLPSSSLACQASTVTVTACANGSSPCTSPVTTISGATASLSTSGATLGASTVTFNGSGVATTTLTYPTAPNGTTSSVALSGESVAATHPRQCCPNGTACQAASSCSTTFNTAGFIVAGSAGGAAVTVPAQTAGTSSGTLFLRAVQTNTTTGACTAALSGAQTVNWAAQCNNPGTCAAGNLMSITAGSTTAIAGNPNGSSSASTPVAMSFDANGNAPFSFTYADVGQVTLWPSKPAGGSLLAALGGATNAFVVKPAGFTVDTIRQTASPGLANPGAVSASGARFVMAGESFGATVTARTAGGAAAPNFGRETVPEGVQLVPSLLLPSPGVAGTLANATVAGGSFASGAATVGNLSYSEVGIVTLTPRLADTDYLGAGDVVGAISGPIGRFVPASFALGAPTATHRAALACAPASTFTYLDEAFRLAFTLTAQNLSGGTTRNYAGSFAKLDLSTAANLGLTGRDGATVFSTANGRLSLGSASGAWDAGVAASVTLTASARRATPADGPFDAAFGIAPVDGDGVALATFDMASTAGGTNDLARVATLALRHGRLRLSNAIGAADRPLALPAVAQSWNGSAWATNALDSCTAVAGSAVSFGNLRRGLTAADARVASGIALAGGVGSLRLAAPGGGRSGSVDLALSLGSSATDASCLQPWTPEAGATAGAAMAYLRGAWCGSSSDKDPSARATFGRQRGLDHSIYRRENH